jgi:protein involved in polysaccharide export with SLBB domain
LAFGCAGGVTGAGAQTNVEQAQTTPTQLASAPTAAAEPVTAPPRPIAAAGPEYRVGPGDRIRIISARKATAKEQRDYARSNPPT